MGWSLVVPPRRKPTHNAPWAGMFESWSMLTQEFTPEIYPIEVAIFLVQICYSLLMFCAVCDFSNSNKQYKTRNRSQKFLNLLGL